MSDKVNPSSKEGERAILCSVLQNSKVLDDVSAYLHKDYFYFQENARAFEILSNMHHNNEPIDIATVCGRLTEKDKADGVDAYYITGLMDNPTSNPMHYAKQVYEKHLLRSIIKKTTLINESAYSNNTDIYNLMSDTHTSIGALMDVKPGTKFVIEDELEETVDNIQNSDVNIIKTGFNGIDSLAGGLTRGEITILGGRPGHGKTTAMINVVKGCIEQGLKVLVVNREMTNVEMLKKILVLESGELSYLSIRKGILNDLETIAKLDKAKKKVAEKYSEDKFCMFDNLNTFSQSAAEIKKFKPDVIFDDYIQLISPEQKFDHRRFQLEKLVNDYKWLAKSQNACVFLLSQLNRALEVRGDGRPKLSDIAESGAIEQVAENVLFVYYDFKINGNASKYGANQLEIIGSKVRYGNSGNAVLHYEGDKVKLTQG
jgi:replicative DNA helicase